MLFNHSQCKYISLISETRVVSRVFCSLHNIRFESNEIEWQKSNLFVIDLCLRILQCLKVTKNHSSMKQCFSLCSWKISSSYFCDNIVMHGMNGIWIPFSWISAILEIFSDVIKQLVGWELCKVPTIDTIVTSGHLRTFVISFKNCFLILNYDDIENNIFFFPFRIQMQKLWSSLVQSLELVKSIA